MKWRAMALLLLFALPLSGFFDARALVRASSPPVRLSFILTNDLHGHLAPGLTLLGSITAQLRALPETAAGKAAVLVLDSGDQFQGTLLSNNDEGESIIRAMNAIGYDAAVPGNHDYDFGPVGWLYDRVSPGETSDNPKEVIERLANIARFPLLSANTFLKASLTSGGRALELDSRCRPSRETPRQPLDFENGNPPPFLRPYAIVERAGVRIALIGIDHPNTASTTTPENVSDLCFDDEVASYLRIRRKLEGRADVFVLLMHNGNTEKVDDASEVARKILAAHANGVHLVAAGHTHFVHNDEVSGVRVIQDGAKGKLYGRADLFFDPETRSVLASDTLASAGIPIAADKASCEKAGAKFACERLEWPLRPTSAIDEIVLQAMKRVEPLAGRKLGVAEGRIATDRTRESPLGNALADALRTATKAEIAVMNTGGIRAALPAGEIEYQHLFETLPFQNQAVILSVPWKKLKTALNAAVRTCGRYGTLALSGLRVLYERNCPETGGDLDPKARLLRVETAEGSLLYDALSGFETAAERAFRVTTLDFIASGGGGYSAFEGLRIESHAGIARELISELWENTRPTLRPAIDLRFKPVR